MTYQVNWRDGDRLFSREGLSERELPGLLRRLEAPAEVVSDAGQLVGAVRPKALRSQPAPQAFDWFVELPLIANERT